MIVDSQPFRDWVARKMAAFQREGYSFHEAEYRCGLSQDKKIPPRISLEMIDRALLFEGSTRLFDLYPEAYR